MTMSATIFDLAFSFSFVKVERTAAKYARDVHASQLMRFGESVFCAALCFGFFALHGELLTVWCFTCFIHLKMLF